MPLSKSGMEVLKSMKNTYKDPKKANSVFYASQNKGIPGSDKWEKNPGIDAPPGEHVAAIHANMENIGTAMNRIAEHVSTLKDIQERRKIKKPKIPMLKI